ncbi:MAG: sigma-70 family RNA polymerase sigma factor [Spirochaeta sp.]|nr:sigma-70 family RNA polymerase sigma factor [Spirochaeta sp.]
MAQKVSSVKIDQGLFEEAYETLYPLIHKLAYRITGDVDQAEDLCHEAFIKYFERKKPLPDINQTKYWLIRVVKNISFNYEKKKSRQRKAFEKLKKRVPIAADSVEHEYIKKETINRIQRALDKIPYRLRMVVVLKEYAGLNYREIGAILGISEGNVKIRIFRARQRLAQLLKEETDHVS